MNNKRVLIFSSSRTGNGGFLEFVKPALTDFLGSKTLTIAFIPFASVQKDHEDYAQMVRDALQGTTYAIEAVLPHNARAVIEKADAIMTGGGNTFKLLHDLYEYDVVDLIRDRVNTGIPYIGWSAGSNIAGPTICTTNDMPVIEPKSFTALDLLPFQINPHYYNITIPGFNGETRDQRLTEFLILNKNTGIIGLPEGTALKLENNNLNFIGEAAGTWFKGIDQNGSAITKPVNAGDDLSSFI